MTSLPVALCPFELYVELLLAGLRIPRMFLEPGGKTLVGEQRWVPWMKKRVRVVRHGVNRSRAGHAHGIPSIAHAQGIGTYSPLPVIPIPFRFTASSASLHPPPLLLHPHPSAPSPQDLSPEQRPLVLSVDM